MILELVKWGASVDKAENSTFKSDFFELGMNVMEVKEAIEDGTRMWNQPSKLSQEMRMHQNFSCFGFQMTLKDVIHSLFVSHHIRDKSYLHLQCLLMVIWRERESGLEDWLQQVKITGKFKGVSWSSGYDTCLDSKRPWVRIPANPQLFSLVKRHNNHTMGFYYVKHKKHNPIKK